MAGLPLFRARVRVGPPLSASWPSFGLVVTLSLVFFVKVQPAVFPIRLCPFGEGRIDPCAFAESVLPLIVEAEMVASSAASMDPPWTNAFPPPDDAARTLPPKLDDLTVTGQLPRRLPPYDWAAADCDVAV